MAKLLFRLRNVHEDEAAEVRALLADNDIAFYETEPGNWGISMPALWVHDDSQWDRAKQLLDAYQHERTHRIREEYQALKQSGEAPGLFDGLFRNPVQFISYLLLVAAILYISVSTFF